MLRKKILSLFALLLVSMMAFSWSGKNSVKIFCEVTNGRGKGLTEVMLSVYDAETKSYQFSQTCDDRGDFTFALPVGKEYEIALTKKGYITKKILINTIVEEGRKKLKYEFDIVLSRNVSRTYAGAELLDKPIVRVYYNPKKNEFDYDMLYAQKIEKELKGLAAKKKMDMIKKLELKAMQDSLEESKLMASIVHPVPGAVTVSETKPAQQTAMISSAPVAGIGSAKTDVAVKSKGIDNKVALAAMADAGSSAKTVSKPAVANEKLNNKDKKTLFELENKMKIRNQQIINTAQVSDKTNAEILLASIEKNRVRLSNSKDYLQEQRNTNLAIQNSTTNPYIGLMDMIDDEIRSNKAKRRKK